MDLNKCICDAPGFCPVFNRTMGENPPDWKWCQKTEPKERKQYYELLCKSPPPAKKKLAELLIEFKDDQQKLFLYYLTHHNRHHRCSIANTAQSRKNIEIIKYIKDLGKTNTEIKNVEILCLGHNEKQFDTIPDRPYLKKINLNLIDAGKYSDNKWGESRAFVADNLFANDTDFVGFVTASWNKKYEPFSFIENFHNWNYAPVLLNSRPEDKIVLCADIFCPCSWVSDNGGNSILSYFFTKDPKDIGAKFLELMGVKDYKHIRVPFGHQLIMHRDLFETYKQYLIQFDILDKIDDFVNNYAIKYLQIGDLIRDKYQNNRLQAYLMEMFSCFWFSKQDWIYLPNTERREDWYSHKAITNRIQNFT